MTAILLLGLAIVALGFSNMVFLARIHSLQKDVATEIAKIKARIGSH
jgi:hypothetical protein